MLSDVEKEMFDDIVKPTLANVCMINMKLDDKPVAVVAMYEASGIDANGVIYNFFPLFIAVNEEIQARMSHDEYVPEGDSVYHGKYKENGPIENQEEE